MESDDTPPAAQLAQVQAWQRMGGARRAEAAIQMSDDARAIAMEGVRCRHPEYAEFQVRQAMLRMVLGDVLYKKAWPHGLMLAP